MTSNGSKSGLDLGTLLDTYGADTDRWPERSRAQADAIIAADPQAGRRLAEAKAFEAVLSRAPVPSAERRVALASRILAAAEQAKPVPAAVGQGASSGMVIPWPRGSRRRSAPAGLITARAPAWRAMALLAASLTVGVFLGAFNMAPASVEDLVEAVSLDETEQAVVSFTNDGLAAALDEDYL